MLLFVPVVAGGCTVASAPARQKAQDVRPWRDELSPNIHSQLHSWESGAGLGSRLHTALAPLMLMKSMVRKTCGWTTGSNSWSEATQLDVGLEVPVPHLHSLL